MEQFKDTPTVLAFALLFMPGFVSTRVFDLMVPGQARDYGKLVYEVVGYSFFTYAVWSWLLVGYYVGWRTPLWATAILAVIILFVTPALLPIILIKIVRGWLASHVLDPCPSAWDWSFKVNSKAMLLLHLRDGRKLGGSWDRTALCSTYPVAPDIFISDVWNIDQESGEFVDRVPDSRGLFMWGSDIEMVEFFDIDEIRSKADGRRQKAIQ
jgi:Family of unknown function (DUF6338)